MHLCEAPVAEHSRKANVVDEDKRRVDPGGANELFGMTIVHAKAEYAFIEFEDRSNRVLDFELSIENIAHELVSANDGGTQLPATLVRVVNVRESDDVMNATFHAEHGMHCPEGGAGGRPDVVQDLDSKSGLLHLPGLQTEGGGDHVQCALYPGTVDKGHCSRVGRGIVEGRDTGCAAESLSTETNDLAVAAEVDVLACEWALSREHGHALHIDRSPEVHGLSADEDDVPLEIPELRENGAYVGIAEVGHSSGFEPRALMRTRGNTNRPFSRQSCSRVFLPDARSRASCSRDICFSRARSLGSNRLESTPRKYDVGAVAQRHPDRPAAPGKDTASMYSIDVKLGQRPAHAANADDPAAAVGRLLAPRNAREQ